MNLISSNPRNTSLFSVVKFLCHQNKRIIVLWTLIYGKSVFMVGECTWNWSNVHGHYILHTDTIQERTAWYNSRPDAKMLCKITSKLYIILFLASKYHPIGKQNCSVNPDTSEVIPHMCWLDVWLWFHFAHVYAFYNI